MKVFRLGGGGGDSEALSELLGFGLPKISRETAVAMVDFQEILVQATKTALDANVSRGSVREFLELLANYAFYGEQPALAKILEKAIECRKAAMEYPTQAEIDQMRREMALSERSLMGVGTDKPDPSKVN